MGATKLHKEDEYEKSGLLANNPAEKAGLLPQFHQGAVWLQMGDGAKDGPALSGSMGRA